MEKKGHKGSDVQCNCLVCFKGNLLTLCKEHTSGGKRRDK